MQEMWHRIAFWISGQYDANQYSGKTALPNMQ
jgi:hypothetical protein